MHQYIKNKGRSLMEKEDSRIRLRYFHTGVNGCLCKAIALVLVNDWLSIYKREAGKDGVFEVQFFNICLTCIATSHKC